MVTALTTADASVRGVSAPHELVLEAAPDLVVMHWSRVTATELDVARRLKHEHGELHLVVVCDAPTGRAARRAVDCGIEGIVFVDDVETALGPTVAAVLAGQTVTPTQLGVSGRKPSLSFREKQILGLVAVGLTNSQIGVRLYLAESTVKSHLSSVFNKLGVNSRSEAADLILDPNESLGVEIMRIARQLDDSAFAATG